MSKTKGNGNYVKVNVKNNLEGDIIISLKFEIVNLKIRLKIL